MSASSPPPLMVAFALLMSLLSDGGYHMTHWSSQAPQNWWGLELFLGPEHVVYNKYLFSFLSFLFSSSNSALFLAFPFSWNGKSKCLFYTWLFLVLSIVSMPRFNEPMAPSQLSSLRGSMYVFTHRENCTLSSSYSE